MPKFSETIYKVPENFFKYIYPSIHVISSLVEYVYINVMYILIFTCIYVYIKTLVRIKLYNEFEYVLLSM